MQSHLSTTRIVSRSAFPLPDRPVILCTKALLSVVVLLILFGSTACSSPSAEDRIRIRLAELVTAIEEKDRSEIQKILAFGFTAKSQGESVDANLLMLVYFRQVKQIRIQTYAVEVEVEDRAAQVRLNAVVMGGQGLLPERVNLFETKSAWITQDGDDWQLTSAEWQRLEINGEDLPTDIKRVLGI